ncbi:hypothetical protein ABC977_01775 [Thioalkalicoccus limnaeus]|uniref:Glutamate-ammonia-ligase adenylyltransferase n=1 Tax=Thioalkalicoccus limnaeus TaxID=120681 RepID=A0ABV4B9S3_9GAMM
MDRFTRNYSIAVLLLVVGLLSWWFLASWNPRVADLNRILEADAELASYPYTFRVVALDEGVATLSSPRDFDHPAYRFLPLITPELAGKPQDHPDMVAAQERLIHHQRRAQALIIQQPDVDEIRWAFDRRWYTEKGFPLP